jgi:tetratricopeptide (TPR) repeat protein
MIQEHIMPTAIELYRNAYDLDYRKGDWQQAEAIYRQIIEQYPYSDEKEYSLVHIERLEQLKANPRDRKLQPVRAAAGHGKAFDLLNFALILALSLALAATAYFVWNEYQHRTYLSLLLQASISEKSGNISGAETFSRKAQALLPENPLAYRFLAELYLAQGQLDHADIVRKKWDLVAPGSSEVSEFRERLSEKFSAAGSDR